MRKRPIIIAIAAFAVTLTACARNPGGAPAQAGTPATATTTTTTVVDVDVSDIGTTVGAMNPTTSTSTSTSTTTTTLPTTTTTKLTIDCTTVDATPFPWMGGDSPLGVLRDGVTSDLHPPEVVEYAYLSGVPCEPYKLEEFWIIPFYFGEHPNTSEKMVIQWLFGSDGDFLIVTQVTADVLEFDPTVVEKAFLSVDTDRTVVNFVESLKTNWMYPMRLIVKIDENPNGCPEGNTVCPIRLEFLEQRQEEARHNAEIVSYLKGERDDMPVPTFAFRDGGRAVFWIAPKPYEVPWIYRP